MFLLMYIFLQIVAENFPISSSGHLALLEKMYFFLFKKKYLYIPSSFDYILHLPTIIIVLCYFYQEIYTVLRNVCMSFKHHANIILSVCIVDGITLFAYPLKHYLSHCIPVWIGFLVTAAALYSLRHYSKSTVISLYQLTIWQSCMIAVAQVISFLPGVSRFCMTYVAGRAQGFSGCDAFFFSFLVALPLFAAAAFKGLYDFWTIPEFFYEIVSISVLVTVVVATICSLLSFIFVGRLIRTNRLWYIAYYMMLLASCTMIVEYAT